MLNWLKGGASHGPARVARLVEEGLTHHRAGRIARARNAYEGALALDASHADAHYLRGLTFVGEGRHAEALEGFRSALGIDAANAGYHVAIAASLRALQRPGDALHHAGAAVAIDGTDASARNELGLVLVANGNMDAAVEQFEAATRAAPGMAEAWANTGNAYLMLGRPAQAVGPYREALRLEHPDPGVRINLATALRGTGRSADAIALCHTVLAKDPDAVHASILLAALLEERGEPDDARVALESALEFAPEDASLWTEYGFLLQRSGALEAATSAYRRALSIEPSLARALNNLGMVLFERHCIEEAEVLLVQAAAREASAPEAWSNLGNLRVAQGRIDEALAAFDQASASGLASADARFDRSLALLTAGRLEEGFAAYESRFHTSPWSSVRQDRPGSPWRGESLAGRTLFLWCEQGIGDTLQFVRYTRTLTALGANLVVMVQPPLKRLLQHCLTAHVIVPGEPLPPIDHHCALMSLPHLLGTTLTAIPWSGPYLSVPREAAAAMRERLSAVPRPRVGIAWAGNPVHRNDRNRSLPVSALAPLLRVADANFVSLQFPATTAIPNGVVPPRWYDFMPHVTDLADTAALLEELDLVITVDTSVAHLAGGLGRPAWLLLPFAPDWRWLLGREDTPWYPSLSLKRQPRPGDWTPVMDAVARDLSAFLSKELASPC